MSAAGLCGHTEIGIGTLLACVLTPGHDGWHGDGRGLTWGLHSDSSPVSRRRAERCAATDLGSGVRCELGAGHRGVHMGTEGTCAVGWANADATPTGGSTQDGPALHAAGNRAQQTADGSAGGVGTSGPEEAVRDLLGPPVGSMPGIQRMVTEALRAGQLGLLVEAYQRGERDALDRADWHLRGEASRMRRVPLYQQRLAEWQQADTDDEVAYGLAYRRYVNLDARVRGIERAADHVADLARDAPREGTAGAPAIDRALSGTGWTYADVTAALRNLLEGADERIVANLLDDLGDYRARRGPGRRRAAVEPTGGTGG